VRSADRILVMRMGEIIEEGNHEALMKHGKHYAELYNTYFRHQSLEYVEEAGKHIRKQDVLSDLRWSITMDFSLCQRCTGVLLDIMQGCF
jgi:ABC-type dipeptide/oligopeptide/nickel transport system ATPase component